MTTEHPVVLTVPEEVLRAHVQAAVVQALSAGDPTRFVETLVREVLTRKKNSYDRATLLEETIATMIKKVADEFCQEYVASLQPAIKMAVKARLKRRSKFADEIAAKLVEALVGNVRASITISVNAEER